MEVLEENVIEMKNRINQYVGELSEMSAFSKDGEQIVDNIYNLYKLWKTPAGSEVIARTEEEAAELENNRLSNKINLLANEQVDYTKETVTLYTARLGKGD